MARELTNRSVEHLRRSFELLIDERDIRGALATWADDATVTLYDQGGFVVSTDLSETYYEDIVNDPDTIDWSTDGVAVRGDLLCLTSLHTRRQQSGFGVDVWMVQEIDDGGLQLRSARFDSDNLKAAHDCLNQWWIESLPPELGTVITAGMRMSNLVEDGDVTSLKAVLDENFTLIDHRPMSFGQLDKAGTLDMWLDRSSETPGLTVIAPRFFKVTAEGYVGEFESVLSDGFTSGGVALTTVRAGSITQAEFFGAHDLDTALARFDELTSTLPT